MVKRHRSRVELLPHDAVEIILERVPGKSLRRFRSVSKRWKSTIDSRRFHEQQLIRRRQSRGADMLLVSIVDYGEDCDPGRMRTVLGSSEIWTVSFSILTTDEVCHGSCDGLLFLSHFYKQNVVINPATGWHQSFLHSCFQQLCVYRLKKGLQLTPCKLGFGKDKSTGTYKPVLLYNSSELGLDSVTSCEVFDFSTNAWRYVLHASSYQIITCQLSHCRDIIMSTLDNRLCVSEKNWPTQVIWSFVSSGGNKTWEKICSIDLTQIFFVTGNPNGHWNQ
ncbi:hypothetical protein EUTSA_v10000283mg [Eutrema salsugineum]|uniref:F-box domain-containing protein n=1 Tax=Eutrema salsugineum TaxID=72664 RepID=V4M389_EUTSA|nr:hypothetical protein EUTSA_v10000283mg [Eutrema salsugineum]